MEKNKFNLGENECEQLKKMLDFSSEMICMHDEQGVYKMISASVKQILGFEPEEVRGKNIDRFIHSADIDNARKVIEQLKKQKEQISIILRFNRVDGEVVYLDCVVNWVKADKMFYAVAKDVTSLIKGQEALKKSEEKYKTLFYNSPLPTLIFDSKSLLFLDVNNAAINTYGYTREEFLKMPVKEIFVRAEFEKVRNAKKEKTYSASPGKGIWGHKKKNGEMMFAEVNSFPINFQGCKARLVLLVDKTGQVKAEKELKKAAEKYHFLSEAAHEAIWDWDLKTGHIQWNEGVKRMFEIPSRKKISSFNWWTENIHASDKQRVQQKLQHHIQSRLTEWEDEYRFQSADGSYKYIHDRGYFVFDENKMPVRMIGVMQNLTERKANEDTLHRLNASLEKRAKELSASNEELEKFAYVASHDLQEPLRMITSFLQLLEKKYKPQLDTTAQEYISYAVDGAERMKKLILDLLQYSRLNSAKIEKENVDINKVVGDVELIYQSLLKETKGTIKSGTMPVIKASKTQMLQLFQNLVGNALKYKSDAAPQIEISCSEEEKLYEFSIADNGIGIASKFHEKIFVIFQRLHQRDKYGGTGIGLAICKKIVEKHGGKIWISSSEEKGSTFYFTLPKSQ